MGGGVECPRPLKKSPVRGIRISSSSSLTTGLGHDGRKLFWGVGLLPGVKLGSVRVRVRVFYTRSPPQHTVQTFFSPLMPPGGGIEPPTVEDSGPLDGDMVGRRVASSWRAGRDTVSGVVSATTVDGGGEGEGQQMALQKKNKNEK